MAHLSMQQICAGIERGVGAAFDRFYEPCLYSSVRDAEELRQELEAELYHQLGVLAQELAHPLVLQVAWTRAPGQRNYLAVELGTHDAQGNQIIHRTGLVFKKPN